MAAEWHVTRQGKQYGPFTEEKIRGLVATKRLSADDLIWRQGMAQWVAAGSVLSLFPRREIASSGFSGTVPSSRTAASEPEIGVPVINLRAKPSGVYRPKKTNRTVYPLVAVAIPLALIAALAAVFLGTSQPASRKQRSSQVRREQPASSEVASSRTEVEEASSSESNSAQAELRERIISKLCEVSITHAVEQRGKLVSAQARVLGLSGNASMGPIYSPNRPAMLMQLETLIRRKTAGVTDQSQFEFLVQATAQAWMADYLTAPIGRGVVE